MKRAETPREAARREVGEETGLAARIHALTGTYRRSDGSCALVFIASVAPWAELCGPTDEICCQRWVPQDEALQLLSKRARRRLADALAAPVPMSVAARSTRRRAWSRVYA